MNAIETLLNTLADDLANRILARLQGLPGLGSPRYATAKSNPLGSRRAFVAAVKRNDFPTFKPGRSVAARWEDVEAFALQHKPANERTLEDELALAARPKKRKSSRAA